MKTILVAAALFVGLATAVNAGGLGKPCTAEPKEKWMALDAIEKIVTDHGYVVAKSKIKNACAEIYARDKQGVRVELFIGPASGNPVGTDWKSPEK